MMNMFMAIERQVENPHACRWLRRTVINGWPSEWPSIIINLAQLVRALVKVFAARQRQHVGGPAIRQCALISHFQIVRPCVPCARIIHYKSMSMRAHDTQ